MKLESVQIYLQTYGPNEGKYEGKVRFKDTHGAIEVVMDSSMSDEVLKVCADAIVKNARAVATDLTATCIEQVNQTKELPNI